MALRVAEFDLARREAETLVKEHPASPETLSLYGDALWAAGLFELAEIKYRDALPAHPDLPRGHHRLARSFAARTRLDDPINAAQAATQLPPPDLVSHPT